MSRSHRYLPSMIAPGAGYGRELDTLIMLHRSTTAGRNFRHLHVTKLDPVRMHANTQWVRLSVRLRFSIELTHHRGKSAYFARRRPGQGCASIPDDLGDDAGSPDHDRRRRCCPRSRLSAVPALSPVHHIIVVRLVTTGWDNCGIVSSARFVPGSARKLQMHVK